MQFTQSTVLAFIAAGGMAAVEALDARTLRQQQLQRRNLILMQHAAMPYPGDDHAYPEDDSDNGSFEDALHMLDQIAPTMAGTADSESGENLSMGNVPPEVQQQITGALPQLAAAAKALIDNNQGFKISITLEPNQPSGKDGDSDKKDSKKKKNKHHKHHHEKDGANGDASKSSDDLKSDVEQKKQNEQQLQQADQEATQEFKQAAGAAKGKAKKVAAVKNAEKKAGKDTEAKQQQLSKALEKERDQAKADAGSKDGKDDKDSDKDSGKDGDKPAGPQRRSIREYLERTIWPREAEPEPEADAEPDAWAMPEAWADAEAEAEADSYYDDWEY